MHQTSCGPASLYVEALPSSSAAPAAARQPLSHPRDHAWKPEHRRRCRSPHRRSPRDRTAGAPPLASPGASPRARPKARAPPQSAMCAYQGFQVCKKTLKSRSEVYPQMLLYFVVLRVTFNWQLALVFHS
jgi:hypothetical protein